ncbi:unnamed protein product [Rotaria magnacalcarata]|uniref:AP-3 complex subunit delta n=1 Tax=Rotaria magnacalcarata TaxID=392030 RepID=A0A816ZB09_9BILA|nr:unnamed protein product [Rotaria magnacalcarata]CAF4061231.1 unnamed protein product [Rotaria magnacalcarata]
MPTTMDQVVKKAKDSFGPMFDKSLHDLVRGIRNHKENEAKYINEAIDEIKQELKQENIAIKANAVNKLTYLQMLGYDISWSSFNVIEVMSSNKFTFKRIGYLAASQSFHEGTDVLMLTTNMIRKDLNSSSMYEVGIAMSGLSCFINADLARDLANDIMSLMTSTKPYIRKRAVLLLYKVFLNNPDALKPAFPRLREKLEDPDPGVQAAAVNVICELARRNPKNYLPLAPIFFRLMTTSANNWVLIKIIKLFGALTPLEPRLGKKLIEPLTNLIHSTSAMSLLYECINTVIAVLVSISSGLPNHNASIQLCVQKLRILIEDSDQNLKYLGLLAMSRILQTHPKSVQAHHDLIMQCLDDKDESIRLRALDLLTGMVSRKNLMDVVRKLMIHMSKAEGTHYRDELLSKVIDICSQSDYQHITNFEWYISILVELTRLEGTKHGSLIALQLLDVAVRVESIREFACSQMAILLENAHVFIHGSNSSNVAEVLYSAAWICGEFSSSLKNPQKTLEAMLNTKVILFPGHIQSVYYQNILKIITHLIIQSDNNEAMIKELVSLCIDKMSAFLSSGDVEAQERASVILNILKSILKLIEKHEFNVSELSALFDGILNPVAGKAQRKVAVPNGLDLDAWINDPPSDSEDESEKKRNQFDTSQTLFAADSTESYYHGSNLDSYSGNQSDSSKPKTYVELSSEEIEQRRENRKQSEKMNPFYLKDSAKANSVQKIEASPTIANSGSRPQATTSKATLPANLQLSLSDQLYRQSKIDEENRRLKKKSKSDGGSSKKGKKKGSNTTNVDDNEEDLYPVIKVTRGGELPEGVTESGNEDNDNDEPTGRNKKLDPHRALNIDFEEKPMQTPPVQIQEPAVKPVETPPVTAEKPKKPKKNKTVEKEEKSSTSKTKTKSKRERSDYKELLSPADDEKKAIATSSSPTTTVITTEEKPKKKKIKEKKSTNNENPTPLLFDMMSDDINVSSVTSQPYQEQSIYKPTAECDNLTIETSIIPTPTAAQLDVTFLLKNRTSSIIDHIDVHVIDSLSSKLLNTTRPNHVSFPSITLFPNSQNYIHIYFGINAISFPQKLKATLTYSINKPTNETQTDKIEFKIDLPCSQYLRKKSLDSDGFADLMSSGTLTIQSHVSISSSSQDFSAIIRAICQSYRLTVVHEINSAASLYSETILGHPIALLFKSTNTQNGISIDGKSTETHFLSNLLEELKNSSNDIF